MTRVMTVKQACDLLSQRKREWIESGQSKASHPLGAAGTTEQFRMLYSGIIMPWEVFEEVIEPQVKAAAALGALAGISVSAIASGNWLDGMATATLMYRGVDTEDRP